MAAPSFQAGMMTSVRGAALGVVRGMGLLRAGALATPTLSPGSHGRGAFAMSRTDG